MSIALKEHTNIILTPLLLPSLGLFSLSKRSTYLYFITNPNYELVILPSDLKDKRTFRYVLGKQIVVLMKLERLYCVIYNPNLMAIEWNTINVFESVKTEIYSDT